MIKKRTKEKRRTKRRQKGFDSRVWIVKRIDEISLKETKNERNTVANRIGFERFSCKMKFLKTNRCPMRDDGQKIASIDGLVDEIAEKGRNISAAYLFENEITFGLVVGEKEKEF